ncbi:heme biosynthesis protein HemY [Sneathiella limimaris]|uniref:heme biosynthesis protein HemY n=1 Tax=Sneathiella limimaris TaxID=1964213 RepID=UPI00146A4870|nr:heme biosynthesis HemY N-terminal domain-containing protein [Sneathiella limimaris]
MIRAVYLFIVIAILSAAGVWLADNPGAVNLRWGNYVVETSMVVLVGLAAVLALVISLLILVYRWIRSSPGRIGGLFASRKRSKGMDAISHGMVAIASGNPDAARRAAIDAEKHLKGEPLTLLLAAQAAELNKDERATEVYYSRMTEQPETELLGLRGLISQAKRNNDLPKALDLVKRADRLKPGTEWVTQDLLLLNIQLKKYEDALQALDSHFKGKASRTSEFQRMRAILTYELALEQVQAGKIDIARQYLQQSRNADKTFVPAAVKTIQLASEDRKREKLISAIWTECPHPEVVDAIQKLVPVESEGDWLARAKRLFDHVNPGHRDSLLALAKAALAAREWGEARAYLIKLVDTDPTAEVYRLLADLEERANADAAAARKWIQKSVEAKPDPAWHCNGCGRQEASWQPTCPTCHKFDGYVWRSLERGGTPDLIEAEVVTELPVSS